MKTLKKRLLKIKAINFNKIPIVILNASKTSAIGSTQDRIVDYDEYNTKAYSCERFYKSISQCV
jgi:hypothetical protein